MTGVQTCALPICGEEESAEEATIEEVVATDSQTAEENTLTLEEASVCDTLD